MSMPFPFKNWNEQQKTRRALRDYRIAVGQRTRQTIRLLMPATRLKLVHINETLRIKKIVRS